MAVNSGNQNVGTRVPPVQEAQPQQTYQDQQQHQPRRWSFHNKSDFGRKPLGKSIGSEALIVLNDALTNEYKKANSDFIIKSLLIDNANSSAHFSCIVLCLQDKLNPKSGVSYHTLIVEASAPLLLPRNQVVEDPTAGVSLNVEITLVTSDSYDEDLYNIILDKVKKEYPGVVTYNTLATVVPATFNVADTNAVHRFAAEIGYILSTEIDLRTGANEFNLAYAAGDSRLQVALSFSKDVHENCVGQPVRSDVNVNFISQQTKWTPTTSPNSGDRAENIAVMYGFVDLVWFRSMMPSNSYAPNQQQSVFGAQNNVPTQQYFPRFVITEMDSGLSSTPSFQLLQLVTATAVSSNSNWMQAFKHAPSASKKKKRNMHDIGAIGIEVTADSVNNKLGQPFDTTSDMFRPEHLGQLLNAFIVPGMTLSLDVPEYGPETSRNNIFSVASNGNIGAIEAIVGAANQLTNNNFSNFFKLGTAMFDDLGNRVHMGYYIDENDQKRDLRELDYLGVANMAGDESPETIRDWSDTFTKVNTPLAIRLSARKKLIMQILPSAVFTGFAHRVTFTTVFMTALLEACKAAGLDMSITTPMNTNDFNNVRATPSFMDQTLISSKTPSVFNNNQNNIQQSSSYGSFNPSRWSR